MRGATALVPLVEGGGHERGLRAGTQNVAGIVAFATALELTDAQRAEETRAHRGVARRLRARAARSVAGFAVNGDPTTAASPGILHVCFPGVEAETLLVALDQQGMYAASGSACSSGAIDPSHVLLAMGMRRDRALSSVRFSLGYASTRRPTSTKPRSTRRAREVGRSEAAAAAAMRAEDRDKVLVMMSGGVDSSVAAALLRDEGHDVTGVTLKLWGGESDSGCCSVADVEDARRVAAQLGIPHYVFNFADAFDDDGRRRRTSTPTQWARRRIRASSATAR